MVALHFWRTAHCARCGNFDLQRISREYVTGVFAWLFRLARLRAFRCDPCRYRFFSILPYRNIRLASETFAEPETESQTVAK